MSVAVTFYILVIASQNARKRRFLIIALQKLQSSKQDTKNPEILYDSAYFQL